MPAIYNSSRQIYSQLFGQSEAVRFEGPWTKLRIGKRSLATLGDAESVLAHLQQQWYVTDLIDSGLLRRTNGRVAIARRLACEGPLLALRAAKDRWPFEVVSARGNLSYSGMPLLCALDDFQTKEQLQASHGNLFLTSDIRDAAVLRALGLPAITATGLAKATIPEIEDLALQFKWNVDGSADEKEQNIPTGGPLRLIVVGRRVSTLDTTEPDGLPDLAELLVQIERNMELDLQDVGIWRPIDADLERAKFFLERNAFVRVRDVFMNSVQDCCLAVTSFADARDTLNELMNSLQRVRESREGDFGLPSPAAARELFRSACDRDLVDPLRQRALSNPDPYMKNLGVMAAEVVSHFYDRMTEMQRHDVRHPAESDILIREQLDLSRQFLAIVKEMRAKRK